MYLALVIGFDGIFDKDGVPGDAKETMASSFVLQKHRPMFVCVVSSKLFYRGYRERLGKSNIVFNVRKSLGWEGQEGLIHDIRWSEK